MDAKTNPVLVLHKHIISFFNIRKGQNETEDEYLVHFNAKQRSLDIMGGEHIFVSPLIMGSDIGLESTEKRPEKKFFSDVLFYEGR